MQKPSKVLITGGNEVGGVGSVADALAHGFVELGIPAEVIRPSAVWQRLRELRDPGILKILSTTAVFAAPLSRRTICIAHGLPCADVQGWKRFLGIIASFKLANSVGAKLVAVSEYTAVHLQTQFNIRFDAVIRNPLKKLYLDHPVDSCKREYITYIGRLHPAKNLHLLLPPIGDVLNEYRQMRACIIGDGPLREQVKQMVRENTRIEYVGCPDDASVREYLRRTKVFVSGNPTEGLGVTYLEALSQGCVVAMPASGGGVELALDQIGAGVQLFSPTLDGREVLAALRRALNSLITPVSLAPFIAANVASAYLEVDYARDDASPRRIPSRVGQHA